MGTDRVARKPRDFKAEYRARNERAKRHNYTGYSQLRKANRIARSRGYANDGTYQQIKVKAEGINDPVVRKLIEQLSRGGNDLETIESEHDYWVWFREVWYPENRVNIGN